MAFKSDIEIAREAKLWPIKEVAKNAGVDEDDLEELLQAIFDGGEAISGAMFDGLMIGETLTKTTLYESFDLIEAVESVQIKIGDTEIGDLTVDDDEVLKLGTVTFNQTVVT